jgi:hypothetical protein
MKIGKGAVLRLSGRKNPKTIALNALFSSIKKVKKPTGEDWMEEDKESEYFKYQMKDAPFYPEEISFIFLVPSLFEKAAIEKIKAEVNYNKQLDIRIMYPMKDISFRSFAIRENVNESVGTIREIYTYCEHKDMSFTEKSSSSQPSDIAGVKMTAKLIFTKKVLDLGLILSGLDFIEREFKLHLLQLVNVKPRRFDKSDVDYAVILLGESTGVLRAIQYIFD